VTRPLELAPPETAYIRKALFAIELLDGATLQRVSQGVLVVAVGLHGKPIVNASGLFVWLDEPGALRKVTIDPGLLPYEKVELDGLQVQKRTVNTVELSPRLDYAFAAGVTGLLARLVEGFARPEPVPDAVVHLRWLDEDDTMRDAPTTSHTNESGDFAAIVRLTANDRPKLDLDGALTVRLRARRGPIERESANLKLAQGRIRDDALTFPWDEMPILP